VTATIGAVGPADFSLANTVAPQTITATAGNPQSATILTAYGTIFAATVKDASNNPISGVVVTFTAPSTGATGTFANGTHVKKSITNSSGVATASVFTANSKAGSYSVQATVPGISPASFSLTNNAGTPHSITATASTPQTTAAGTAFATKFTVLVKDASNNPVSGVVVTFTAPSSGATGTFVNGSHVKTAPTNAAGVAVASAFTANNTQGSYTVTATDGAVGPANFMLTND
jgi:hypothetical protein